jgi:hypothetical protein
MPGGRLHAAPSPEISSAAADEIFALAGLLIQLLLLLHLLLLFLQFLLLLYVRPVLMLVILIHTRRHGVLMGVIGTAWHVSLGPSGHRHKIGHHRLSNGAISAKGPQSLSSRRSRRVFRQRFRQPRQRAGSLKN